MKITDVTVTLFAIETPKSLALHLPGAGGTVNIGLVSVMTDEGIVGHAFVGGVFFGADMDVQSLIDLLKPVLVGQNPLERERLYDEMRARLRRTTWRAIGALDVALWDIAGKTAGMPIHKLLGAYRDRVPAYVSSSRIAGGTPAYVEQALAARKAGYAAYKIHPSPNAEECIELCRAVRDAVGPDYPLMLDPAWAFDFPQALRVGLAIQELDYYWYEDPLADDDIYNYVKLKERLHIPLMATEITPGGYTSFAPWVLQKATDYLRGDVWIKGGITALIKGARLAEAFGMNFELHHGGNSINNIANVHVIMAISNTEFYENFMPRGEQKFGVLNDVAIDDEGYVHAYEGPGLGAEIDFDMIDNNTVTVLS